MQIKDITEQDRKEFNKIVNHPLQAFEWGEFRKKTGVKVIRRGFFKNGKIVDGFQLTIHKIPKIPWTIGYLPKGNLPTQEVIEELKKIGKTERCVFIQLEPNVQVENGTTLDSQLKPAVHPLFTKYTFTLDLTKSEEELLKNMHSKTRYNIRVAQKHGVTITEDPSNEAFESYLRLTSETTKRQRFYAHTEKYHRLAWETLRTGGNELTTQLLVAKYKSETLATWVLFTFHDTLYYPYGASSSEYRNVMASNLIMWETILFGKKLGLKKFDMWGALGPNPDPKDPWFGFHKFKEGYGARLVEFIGSYDLVIRPNLYRFYKTADKIRWSILRFRK